MSMRTRHVGVGCVPPSANDSLSVTADPETDPEMLPSFTLWHDEHDPSVSLTGRMRADPDSAVPDCARTHVNVSGPRPSDPVPVQVPARFKAAGGSRVSARSVTVSADTVTACASG